VKIYTAYITHRHGVNAYISATEQGLRDRIYGFVEDWWHEVEEGVGYPLPEDKDQATDDYFAYQDGSEYCDVNTADLPELDHLLDSMARIVLFMQDGETGDAVDAIDVDLVNDPLLKPFIEGLKADWGRED